MRPEELYATALSVCSSPSFNQIWDLIALYEPEDIYSRLLKSGDVSTQTFIAKNYPADPLSAAEKILRVCRSKEIKTVSYWDKEYPELLKEISMPPLVLYYKGILDSADSIAIVGTRKADKKSQEISRRLSGELSAAGYRIVSGMAIGIDREAHLGALKNKGATVGILANGIDVVYPVYNQDIYSAIISSGNSALVSEYPPGIYAGKWTFVRRNRIISGLSSGTVVVKAAKKSGALITARHALEQNREVFACPGLAFDNSFSGCNELIRNGAVLVSCTDDILKELSGFGRRFLPEKERHINKPVIDQIPGIKEVTVNKTVQDAEYFPDMHPSDMHPSDIHPWDTYPGDVQQGDIYPAGSVERKILNMLTNGDSDIDSIIREVNSSPNEVNEAIVMLELSNHISRDGNMLSLSQ